MDSTILIAGAGQFGSRHLQGMANCPNALDIYVLDISEHSLFIAKKRWEQCFNTLSPSVSGKAVESKVQHKIIFLSSFEKIPKQIDIAIISTNADVRPQVVKKILKNCEVRYWILEKLLAQSEALLDEISSMTQYSAGVWVNTSRRMMSWQQQIRKTLPKKVSLNVSANGRLWGLASNGIHCLDLVSWWTGEKLIEIDNTELDSQWIGSSRKGFFDITGKLKANFSGGSTLSMDSKKNGPPFKLEVEAEGKIWEIDESNGVASVPGGAFITGKNEMQSTMNSRLVNGLIISGQCELTKLPESIELHCLFIRSLLDHWNSILGTNSVKLPST